jgi:peroxiredoxin
VPAVGSQAPDFALVDQHGTPVSLSGLRGRPVLLVFFPWAFSGICGSELAALRDGAASLDVVVLAISVDSMFAQRAFSDARGFEFPLLADSWPHGAVAESYGVLDAERGVAVRGSFLIDSGGVVRWSVVKGIGEARELEAYRTALAALGSPAR